MKTKLTAEEVQSFHRDGYVVVKDFCSSKEIPNEAILEWDAKSLSEADFLIKENDPALKETGWEKSVDTI